MATQGTIYPNMRNRSVGSEKTPLWTHPHDTWSSEEWGFPLLCLSAPPLMARGFSMSSCQDSALVIAFCWQITKMILVLLSILLPLGLPREPHMPGRALLWSVTHLVLSSAPPWVQAITICQLHNFRTSLSELTEDVKRKKKPQNPNNKNNNNNNPQTDLKSPLLQEAKGFPLQESSFNLFYKLPLSSPRDVGIHC